MSYTVSKDKLDAFGLDALCDAIMDCHAMKHIADSLEVSQGSLVAWIAAEPERSARVREARIRTAILWEELAEDRIASATDPFSLSKAKELAHHYRWRASKIAPRDYGDKVQQEITGKDGAPLLTGIEVTYVSPKG